MYYLNYYSRKSQKHEDVSLLAKRYKDTGNICILIRDITKDGRYILRDEPTISINIPATFADKQEFIFNKNHGYNLYYELMKAGLISIKSRFDDSDYLLCRWEKEVDEE